MTFILVPDIDLAQAIAELSARTALSAAEATNALGLGNLIRERDEARAALAALKAASCTCPDHMRDHR